MVLKSRFGRRGDRFLGHDFGAIVEFLRAFGQCIFDLLTPMTQANDVLGIPKDEPVLYITTEGQLYSS